MSNDYIYRDPSGQRISEAEWTEGANSDFQSGQTHADFDFDSYEFEDDPEETLRRAFGGETDDDYDFEDVDCKSCGLKFYIRPSLYNKDSGHPFPEECERCKKGLPPKYEF